VAHLGAGSTAYFREFQSPNFRWGSPPVRAFEVMILSLVALGGLGRLRCTWTELALLLGTLHAALGSVRDMNLCAIVAAPVLADGLTSVLMAWRPELVRRWRAIAEAQERDGSWRVQLPVIAALTIALALGGKLRLRESLDDVILTRGAAEHIAANPNRFARAFNVDSLGGSLIYRLYPDHRVFVDDRTPIYGEPFFEHDYFEVLFSRPGWQGVLDRWEITSAILLADAPCAQLFAASPAWRLDYADEKNVIFVRTPKAGSDSHGT
jgi:hypothetical protein